MVHTPTIAFHERGYAPAIAAPVYRDCGRTRGVRDRRPPLPGIHAALALAGAEVVVVPQAGAEDEWPDGLYEAELRVAAFQNGYYAALCNRVGPESKLTFAGESFVCDPAGRVLARAGRGTDEILIADVEHDEVARSHARRLFMRDRRPELYAEWLGTR
jgi:N-carbamoylputrescine amidase